MDGSRKSLCPDPEAVIAAVRREMRRSFGEPKIGPEGTLK